MYVCLRKRSSDVCVLVSIWAYVYIRVMVVLAGYT